MADAGFSLLWRKFFEHRYWTERRVFSRAEAWIDCWGRMAAFADHERLVGGVGVLLKRGEFMASDRFLERRWGWSRGKVRRFLADAIEENELKRQRETDKGLNTGCAVNRPEGGTIYLVVNYDEYQLGGTNHSTNDGPTTVPTAVPKIIKGNEGNRKKVNRGAQLPEGWEPNDKHKQLAFSLHVNMVVEVEKFRDHHTAKGSLFKDWDAAFRTWLRNSAEFSRKPLPGSEAARFHSETPGRGRSVVGSPTPIGQISDNGQYTWDGERWRKI